jgi:hypothetical protein
MVDRVTTYMNKWIKNKLVELFFVISLIGFFVGMFIALYFLLWPVGKFLGWFFWEMDKAGFFK